MKPLQSRRVIQAVVVKIEHKLIKQNLGFRLYRRALIAENKWRAARYGIHGKLIDFGKKEEVPFNQLALMNSLEFIDDVVDELNSTRRTRITSRKMLEIGTGADRQLEIWESIPGHKKSC
jgi:glutamate---cysteine ligase / carboxylate-amine ligase